MTMLFENRTISMILTVPNVKELSCSVENLDTYSKKTKPPSIPIYQGSIIHIEKHQENENTSDLIVRVPNFHHLSIPSVTISINDQELNESESQREARIKRRAPICPIRTDTQTPNQTNDLGVTNTKRFAIGLRNLRQTIITNCKSKRSTNMNEITIIPVLPDVEVIAGDLQVPTLTKKTNKNLNSTSKFLTPKILFIKRKYLKIKKKHASSSNSVDTQTNNNDQTIEQPNQSIKVNDEGNTTNSSVGQKSTTITQLIPISFIHPESSSTHPETNSSDNILQPAKIDLPINIPSLDDDLEGRLYIVHPNGDTYSECYEVTYEFDPEFQHFIKNEKEQIYLPAIQDQSSIEFKLDPFQYQDLTSSLTPWLPIFPSNNYEQILPESHEQERSTPRVKFQLSEDLSRTNPDQTSIYQSEPISDFSSSEDHNQIASLNQSSITNEDYTIILQFLRHALQIESTIDEDCNEFNKQIKQLFSRENSNELE